MARLPVRTAAIPVRVPSALAASLGERKTPKRNNKTPSATKRRIDAAIEEYKDTVGDKAKRPGEPRHLVALWIECHNAVYGVFPEEILRPEDWLGAGSAAKKMIAECFSGDYQTAVGFLRWVWSREQWFAEKRKERGEETKHRVGWRKQFVYRDLLTDYRAATKDPNFVRSAR